MEKRINEAAIKIIEHNGYDILIEEYVNDWIIAKSDDGIHFIKVIVGSGELPDTSHYILMYEFEGVAATWLRSADPEDVVGDLHGDLMSINVLKDDLGFVRWEHDAVGKR